MTASTQPSRFTPLDLAALLDVVVLEESWPGCRPQLLWLIDQSPEARSMYAELVAEGEDGSPPLLELARLLLAADGKGTSGASRALIRWIAQQIPQTETAMAELEELAWIPPAAPVFGVHYRDLLLHRRQLDQMFQQQEVDALLRRRASSQGTRVETHPPLLNESEAEHVWQFALSLRSRLEGRRRERLDTLLAGFPSDPLLREPRPKDVEILRDFARTTCGSLQEALRRLRKLRAEWPEETGATP